MTQVCRLTYQGSHSTCSISYPEAAIGRYVPESIGCGIVDLCKANSIRRVLVAADDLLTQAAVIDYSRAEHHEIVAPHRSTE